MLPSEISKFDFLGFCLKENYSINASMPTKIAEALACGVPIVCNAFNKDIKNLIEAEGIGFIHNFNGELQSQDCIALIELIKDSAMHKKCSKIAKKQFSLESGVLKYRSIYSNLTS
jgi:glycosyltransferase involved in cell wall biosynthesis